MSIIVGSNTAPSGFTTRERLYLKSAADSNLVVLESSAGAAQILYDTYAQGRYADGFLLRKGAQWLAYHAASLATTFTPSRFASNIDVDGIAQFHSNVIADSNIVARTVIASNMQVVAPATGPTTAPFFQITRPSGEIAAALAGGAFRFSGPVGIGSTAPRAQLDVVGNAYVSDTVYSPAVATQSVGGISGAAANNKILINDSGITVNCDFTVEGRQSFQTGITLSDLTVTNLTTACNQVRLVGNNSNATLLDIYQLNPGECNIVNIASAASNLLSITPKGHLGLGTTAPMGVIDIRCPHDDYIIYAIGSNVPATTFVVDRMGNVGIGTTSPHAALNVIGDAVITGDVDASCFEGHIRTTNIEGPSNIQTNQSSLLNLALVDTCNVKSHDLQIESGRANYMFTSNWEILNMKCFDSNMYGQSMFHILTSNLWFSGYNVVLSRNDTEATLQTANAITDGKLRIDVRSAFDEGYPAGTLSRGMTVNGIDDVSILVKSQQRTATLELQSLATNFKVGVDINQSFRVTNDLTNRFEITNTGQTSISEKFRVDSTGRVGINLDTDAALTQPLEVRGVSEFKNFAGETVLCADGGTSLVNQKAVGIATRYPGYTLHVNGTMGVNSNATFFSNVDVYGILNFNGGLYSNQSPYISSQWTTVSTGIYYSACNVGIGTTAPTAKLHVNGDTRIDGRVFGNTSIVSTSDRVLKRELTPIANALSRVGDLTGYTFERIDTGVRETGLIAQDVAKVLPEAAVYDGKHWSVAYGNLAGLFVEAIKEMREEIASLKLELKQYRTEAGMPANSV